MIQLTTENDADRRPALIAKMDGVRGGERGFDVELWRSPTGRLMVRAYNEAGYNWTEIDLWDLVSWLQDGNGLCDEASRAA